MISLLSKNKTTYAFLSWINAISGYLPLIGICFFTPSALHAQQDSLKHHIEMQLDAVTAQYYYTHLDSALAGYETLAEVAKKGQLWDTYLYTVLYMAWCAERHNDLDTLQYFLRKGEEIAVRHAQARDTSQAYPTLLSDLQYTKGIFYYTTGDFADAIAAFEQIFPDTEKKSALDSMLAYDTYSYLGNAYYRLENYTQAITHHFAAAQWLPSIHENFAYRERAYFQALNWLYLGQCYYAEALYRQKKENFQQSQQLYHQALHILQASSNQISYQNALISNYHLLSELHTQLGQYDSTLHYLDQALALQKEEDRLETYVLFGNTYTALREHEKALAYYHKSSQIAAKQYKNKHYKKAIPLYKTGQVLAQQGQWEQALSHYQQALAQLSEETGPVHDIYANPHFETSGAKRELLEVLLLKAETLWAWYQHDTTQSKNLLSALETYHLISDVVDEMRKVFPSIDYKQFLSTKFFTIYEQAIAVACQAYQNNPANTDFLEQAFYFAEKSKGLLLLESLQNAKAKVSAGVPDTLLRQEDYLMRKISYLEKARYEQKGSETENIALKQELFHTRAAYEGFIKKLEQQYRDYYQLKYNTQVTTLAQIQQLLPDHTAMISYFYGDSTLYSFAITQEKVNIHTMPLQASFHQHLEELITDVTHYDLEVVYDTTYYRRFIKNASQLYTALLRPHLSSFQTDIHKLIVLADGPLGYLPFDVLLTESVNDTSGIRYHDLPYLVRQVPVSYEYSASLWAEYSPRSTSRSAAFTYTGFAPSYDTPELLANKRALPTTMGAMQLSKLKYNQEEVVQVAALFSGKAFLGKEATEVAFKEHAIHSKVLHLSMHAFANDEEPMQSGMIFTPRATDPEDNYLFAYELYNMRMDAELAILSACETGTGALARGEGIMSLGRAFKYAGCPSIAMTLWKVNDQAAHKIIHRFCEELKNGVPKDKAMQLARLSYLEGSQDILAHPYFWAPFIMLGNTHPLTKQPDGIRWYLPGMGILLLALLIAMIWWQRQKKNTG